MRVLPSADGASGSTEPVHAVVIAGGGPTGLMLAGELALAGIDVVIVERRASQDVDGSRAGGLHSRTIEVLDQRGIAERFLSAGQEHPAVGYATIPLDISDFPRATTAYSRSGRATSSPSWPTGSTSSGFRSSVAARWWVSLKTRPASMSSCPATAPSERSTSWGATEDAA